MLREKDDGMEHILNLFHMLQRVQKFKGPMYAYNFTSSFTNEEH